VKRVASAAERDIVVVGGLGMVMGWWWVVGGGRWCRRGGLAMTRLKFSVRY
jgi:hypothetical protein